MRILFYAINGVGLGHVARLSVLADHLKIVEPTIQAFFYSNSQFAKQLLGVEGDTVILPDNLPPHKRASIAYQGFERAISKYLPQIVVCDTHWPIPALGILRSRGIRTVLVLRLVALDRAQAHIERALSDFDLIIIPHSADEAVALYSSQPHVMRLLEFHQIFFSGPIARRSSVNAHEAVKVIFSLGGGGEYHKAAESNSIPKLLSSFRGAAGLLSLSGISSHFARGPHLAHDIPESREWTILRTLNLPDIIDGQTILVGRAGYNTCWEVLASGGRLILVGDHSGFEDVMARTNYLKFRNLAISAEIDATSICSTVIKERSQGWDARQIVFRSAVNIGLNACVRRMLYG